MTLALQRLMHVNANCSSLGRSLAFYREVTGLVPLAHTRPVPQEGAGFGLEGRIQWDAHILHDERGHAGPALDLLEWQQPAPEGRPYPEPQHLGIARLGLLAPDAEAAHARAQRAGARCLSAPRALPVAAGAEPDTQAFLCRDPDGTLLQIAGRGAAPRLAQVVVNCSDLARSAEWYERVLGLPARGAARPGAQPGDAFGLPGEVEWESRFFGDPGGPGFALELCQWRHPAPLGRPYPCANHLGLYRIAFLVEDAAACHAELGRLGVACGPPVWLDMGPEIPIDGLWALFFADPDGACLELIQTPVVR